MIGILRRKVDELAGFDALLKDEQFWADFRAALEERLSDKLLPVFLAGAYAGERVNVRHKHLMGQHEQQTHAHGGFGSPAIGPITERQRKGAEKWMASNGITPETLKANSENMFRSASPDQVAAGKKWYSEAHDYSSNLSDKYGVDIHQSVGVVAACSPRNRWDKNKEAADKVLAAAKANPNMSAAELARTVKTGVTKDNAEKAFRIAKGEDPVKVLGGAKVRSFDDNILEPRTSKEITIDTHMINALTGGKSVGEAFCASVFAKPAVYSVFADAIRETAAAHKLLPNQAQAIIWLKQGGFTGKALAEKTDDEVSIEELDGEGLFAGGDDALLNDEYLKKLERDLREQGWSESERREILADAILYGEAEGAKHLSGQHDQMTHAHGSSGGGEGLAAEVAAFEKKHQRGLSETAMVIKPNGEKYTVRSDSLRGYGNTVEFTDEQLNGMAGATLTHNHPINGSPLSWPDVSVAVRADIAEIRSISKDGYVSSMRAPKGGWDKAKGGREAAAAAAVTPKVVFGAMRASNQKELNGLLQDYLHEFAGKTGATYSWGKDVPAGGGKPLNLSTGS